PATPFLFPYTTLFRSVPRPIRGTHHLPARGFANVPPLGGHLSPRAPGRHRDGSRPLLAPSRRRPHRHRPGGPFLLAQRRHAARRSEEHTSELQSRENL